MSASRRIAFVEAGSPGLNIYSHVAMGRGVPLLATVVHAAGWEARAFIEDVSGKDSIDWEFVAAADVVGFSAITCTMPRSAELVARTRALNPRATILFGGPEPTCSPTRSFEAGADMVLRGEAELTLPRLLAVLAGESEERLGDIEGLLWREEGAVRAGQPMRQLTRDELDALPLVDRSLVHMADAASVAAVWRTRGCPNHCDFCEVCEIYPHCVRRSDDRTLAELMDAQQRGYDCAFLIDDNAAANKPAFMEFLRKAASDGYARQLVTQLRADSIFRKDGRIDREFLKLLRRAAAVTIVCVGVESATDADLEAIHKNVDARRMARALKAMKRAGILVHGMFIALTEDTREAIRRNGDYARKYVTSLQYLFETPLPGTKRTIEHEIAGNLLFEGLEDLALYDGMHCVLRPLRMRAEEMQRLVEREYRRFYSTRRIVGAALKGTFVRFRRLTAGQRSLLRDLPVGRRIKTWFRFHVEYKFGPVAFLAIGHRRLRKMILDPGHAAFLGRLQTVQVSEDPAPRR
jgi:anaerobic magnesium-protoporphyrin IX monomethyl ester cyclase